LIVWVGAGLTFRGGVRRGIHGRRCQGKKLRG
jgi:hypothetical protein